MTEHGMITWSELMTTEVEKAKAFYETTLGVSFEPFAADAEGRYHVAMAGGKPAWGLMDMTGRPDGPRDVVHLYRRRRRGCPGGESSESRG